jgi:hypothetical protein
MRGGTGARCSGVAVYTVAQRSLSGVPRRLLSRVAGERGAKCAIEVQRISTPSGVIRMSSSMRTPKRPGR